MKKRALDFLVITILALVAITVGLNDLTFIGHDTLFHLSRIEGYARSIANGQWIPDIYPFKNDGYGYGSALFYCDFPLILPALLYLANVPISTCGTIYLFVISWVSGYTMLHLVRTLTKNPYSPYLAVILYLFANYRLTNMYCRGAYGEISAMMFLPTLMEGLYRIVVLKQSRDYHLACGLIGLIFTHNISFYLMMIAIGIILMVYTINGSLIRYYRLWIPLIKNMVLAFGVTMVFTLPMIEQIYHTDYYLSWYGSTSDLGESALPLWSLFNPLTVTAGYGSNTMEYYQIMNTSLGLVTTLTPFGWWLSSWKKNGLTTYIKTITCIGYAMLLIGSGIINLDLLPFLKITQFAFRLNGIALVLLVPSAAMVISNLWYSKKILIPLMIGLTMIGMAHQIPYITEGMHIDSSTSYASLIDGSTIDPYYGNSGYVRVEVAGADYLPIGGLNTKNIGHDVRLSDGSTITPNNKVPYIFTITSNGMVHIPITYYYGYTICNLTDDGPSYCKLVDMDSSGMLVASLHEPGTYIINYQTTDIQLFSRIGSLVTILGFSGYQIIRRLRKSKEICVS